MPGEIESNELPEGGWGFFSETTIVWNGSVPRPAAADIEDMADRLRFMGLDEARVLEFEHRAAEDYEAAQLWLRAQLDPLPRPPEWVCDCGEPLVDDDWRGQATVRCSECGARWGLEVKDGSGGSQWSVAGPSDEWLVAHPPELDDPYGDHQPETVIEDGLPPMVHGIEPGTAFPLATWIDKPWAGVLYVYRQRPGVFDLPGDEYGHEIEHLRFDPAGGWINGGSGGGGWINPFAPPLQLLEKYVVLGTGTTGTSDDDGEINLTGGLCSSAVETIELEEDGQRSRIAINHVRRAFLVGSRATIAYIRFRDKDGLLLTDHRGGVLEFQFAGGRGDGREETSR